MTQKGCMGKPHAGNDGEEGRNKFVVETADVTSTNTNRETILERKASAALIQEHYRPRPIS